MGVIDMDIVEFYRTTVTGKVTNAVPRLTLAVSFFNLRGCRIILDVLQRWKEQGL